MLNSNWVDINKLAEILGFNVETLRRSCANNKYINRFKKSGKYKHYEIDITSLPKNYLNKYNKYFEKDNNYLQFNSDEYSNAQEWQRKQADKYLELLSLTEGMTHTKIEQFVAVWNKNNPDKKVSYS
ncbi:hypothetical protein IKQ21_09220, partial [bacterium]|nr:hypothetical protein [bacterium]